MDCLNTMDLLSPSQMSSSPESPKAFGSPTRSSSDVESTTAFGHSSSASSGSLLGPISVTLGNQIYQPGTTTTHITSDYAFGASGTVLLSFGSASNQSDSLSIASSFGMAPSIFKDQSGNTIVHPGGNTAEFHCVFDTALGQSTYRGLLGNAVVSCSQKHEAESANVTHERGSISEMGIKRIKHRRASNYFVDEGGTTKQSRRSFCTRSPLGRCPLWSTEESCRGNCPKLTLETLVHRTKKKEDLRYPGYQFENKGVCKHAPSSNSANTESSKAFVSSVPPQQQPTLNDDFRHNYNEDRSGTVNALIDASDRFLVGVDSRSTTPIFIGGVEVPVLYSDTEVKCKEIVSGTLITGCGNASRWEKICGFVKNEVELHGNSDVHSVVAHIEAYLARYPLTDASHETKMFVVGKSSTGKVHAFTAGDRLSEDDRAPLFEKYRAFGSGGGHAEIVLRNLRKHTKSVDEPKFTLDEAVDHLYRALLQSTLDDECCGGHITVWQVAPDICDKITPPPCGSHCIDLALYFQFKFEDRELFFFDKSSYFHVNFYTLWCFLASLGFETDMPRCFGFVRDDWKLFSVRFSSQTESMDLYQMGISVRKSIRRFTGRSGHGEYAVFVTKASTEILNLARNTGFLREMCSVKAFRCRQISLH